MTTSPVSLLLHRTVMTMVFLILLGLPIERCFGQLPEDSKPVFIENSHAKVGVDLSRGGAIVFFSANGGQNLINNFDRGRQVQLSFFSGPVPYSSGGQTPSKHWQHLGWNPIQAGDDFGNKPRILEHEKTANSIYTKTEPLHWPLDNVPANCCFESWIELDENIVKVRARLKNKRKDKSKFAARLQELPAVYGNANLSNVVTYSGDRPFTNDKVSAVPKSVVKHPWSFWNGTECWSAVLDKKGVGLGLITPNRTFFTGGFAGTPGLGKTRGNSCAYLAGQEIEILDHNIVYDFRFELVAGGIPQIRKRAFELRRKNIPGWRFSSDRQGWHFRNAHDQGWPIKGGLRVDLSQPDPQLISPYTFWQSKDATSLEIRCAITSQDKLATVYWQAHGSNNFAAENFVQFPILGDSELHTYKVNLEDSKNYRGGITRIRIDLCNGNRGDSAVVESIVLKEKVRTKK